MKARACLVLTATNAYLSSQTDCFPHGGWATHSMVEGTGDKLRAASRGGHPRPSKRVTRIGRSRTGAKVNPSMVMEIEKSGLKLVDRDETGIRMEILELPNHPFSVGVQYHLEFKSRPGKPSALFSGLIAASCGQLDALLQRNKIVENKFRTRYIPPSNGHVFCNRHTSRNGISSPKTYQNGNANKPVKSIVKGSLYSNGNGVYA